jgi:hypothetical protein
MTKPRCETWHECVFATGLIDSDQRQPGMNVARPIGVPSRSTISNFPFGNVRVSSGLSKLFESGVWIVAAIPSPSVRSKAELGAVYDRRNAIASDERPVIAGIVG